MMENKSKYWNKANLKLRNIFYPKKIYEHYWQSHDQLIQKWFKLNNKIKLKILKTDMFEEFKSNDFFSYVYCKKHRIYGIDISKIVSLRVNRHKNLHSIVADINKTPFKKNSFDLIISLSTLDHLKVKDFYNVIKQFELILKPKGQVFLTLDNKHNKLYFLEFFFWKYLFSIYDRDKCYEISDVKRILKGSKLKIVGIDAVMHFPAFIDKILIFINLFFPETKIFTDKLSELIVKITNKYVNTAEKRILFGRFLSFKIEKI